MKKALLESLKGIPVSNARMIVRSAGHLVMEVPEGVNLPAVAMPNTVVLWSRDDGMVSEATAGDPLEVR